LKVCKYCNTNMFCEYETLSNSDHYRFFANCPKCRAVYEGEEKKRKSEYLYSKTRWYNPQTDEFEEWSQIPRR
jgi:hypothetical protein